MAELDLRKLRYFMVLAEELNFTRAAARLHLAQPVLSRQIRTLEQELHAQLLTRDSHRTELTAAGRQLQVDGAVLLANAEGVRRRVVRAAKPQASFTVGFMPGLTVTDAVRRLTNAHPELTVEVVRTSWQDQVATLLDGRVDVGYLRMPFDSSGLRTVGLFTESRVVMLPADHPLAGKPGLELADLLGEPLLQHAEAVPEWTVAGGHIAAVLPRSGTVEEKLEHVAMGRGVSVLPESTARYYQRPDVTWVSVDDLGPNEVRLAWLSSRRNPLIAEFVRLAH